MEGLRSQWEPPLQTLRRSGVRRPEGTLSGRA
jgi:hypothetical protein